MNSSIRYLATSLAPAMAITCVDKGGILES